MKQKGTTRHKVLIIIAVVAVTLLAGCMAASAYLLNFALCPEPNKGRDYKAQYAAMMKAYPWIDHWADSLRREGALRDTFVVAADGDRHHALLLDAAKPTPLTAVLIPGYTDCAVNMLHMGYIYNHLMGMNLLIPDLHANGKSDGRAMQMGWKDRTDVMQWIAMADSLHRDSTGHARIVVHGVSMGAATAMNVAGELASPSNEQLNRWVIGRGLNKAVRCVVEDCGYTSAWDEFSYELNDLFHLPDFPLLYSASAMCKARYGWSFGEDSPLAQVAKSDKPMLFIHGGSDTFVPTAMVYKLYKAKTGTKSLAIFRGSAHARSYRDHRHEYEQKVTAFARKYIGG